MRQFNTPDDDEETEEQIDSKPEDLPGRRHKGFLVLALCVMLGMTASAQVIIDFPSLHYIGKMQTDSLVTTFDGFWVKHCGEFAVGPESWKINRTEFYAEAIKDDGRPCYHLFAIYWYPKDGSLDFWFSKHAGSSGWQIIDSSLFHPHVR